MIPLFDENRSEFADQLNKRYASDTNIRHFANLLDLFSEFLYLRQVCNPVLLLL